MPHSDNDIPAPIKITQQIFDQMEADGRPLDDRFKGRVKAMAMRLHKAGSPISADIIQWHIDQGEDHVKNTARPAPDETKAAKALDALDRYHAIIRKKQETEPAPDLSHIHWSHEQARSLLENKTYKAHHIFTALIQGNRHDIIEQLHDDGLIPMDKTPNPLLYAAFELDDVRCLRFIHEQGGEIFYKYNSKAGSLECIKYLLEIEAEDEQADDNLSFLDLCTFGAADAGHMHIYRYLNDNHDVKNEMNMFILWESIKNNKTEFVLAAVEYLKADPHIIQLSLGAAAQDGKLEMYKTIQNHFEAPIFLESEKNSDQYEIERFLPCVIGNGHLDMARHIMADAPDLLPETWYTALELVATTGNIDGARYVMEELDLPDAIIQEKLELHIYLALHLQHWDCADYLVEHFKGDMPHDFKNIAERRNEWQQARHMSPPPGQLNNSFHDLKTSTYNTLHEILSAEVAQNDEDHEERPNQDQDQNQDQDEDAAALNAYETAAERIFSFHSNIYKLSRLFGTASRALDYLEKWGDFSKNRPFSDLGEKLDIPLTTTFNTKTWGDAVLKHGPEMGKLAAYADLLETPPSLAQSRRDLAISIFSRGHENPDFAETCIDQKISEKEFNQTLDVWNELKLHGFHDKNLPDIKIDGETFGKPGGKFYLLEKDDIRGFILGHYTDCCQHILHENGSMPTQHGMASENGGFYCIENKDQQIIGAVWAWRGEKGELVFDSLEHLKGHMTPNKWESLLNAFAAELEQNHTGISDFMVAVDNYEKINERTYEETAIPATPLDYDDKHYRDSRRQVRVWTAAPDKPVVLRHPRNEQDIDDLWTLCQRLFPDTIYSYEDNKAAEPEDTTPEEERLKLTVFAYDKGELAGFADLRHIKSHEDGTGFYLEFLGVDPDKTKTMGRHRIAGHLLEAVEYTVRNAKRKDKTLHFLTHEDNISVQKGIDAMGFDYCGTKEGYFNDGKAAYCYAIDLSKQSIKRNLQAKRTRTPAPAPELCAAAGADLVQIWEPGL